MKKKISLTQLLALFILCLPALITSCSSSKKVNTDYLYFQTAGDSAFLRQREIVIKPNDNLGIQVYSGTQNQEQAAIFNIKGSAKQGEPASQGYQVSPSGNINFPVIGNVKVAGLSKNDLEAVLVQKLVDYVKNPIVVITLSQIKVNVLGEVKMPGIQQFEPGKVTVIDALSAAGDLTDFGRREDVMVLRNENGTIAQYRIDLRTTDLFGSPAYLLQPNDVVYVAPNIYKLKNLSVDPEKQRRTGLIFSIAGIIVSIATLVVTSLR